MSWLTSTPFALLIYLLFAFGLLGVGRALSGRNAANEVQASPYASGEAPPNQGAAPGYRGFFRIALFFAVLHLAVLVLGTAGESHWPLIYTCGLIITLSTFLLE